MKLRNILFGLSLCFNGSILICQTNSNIEQRKFLSPSPEAASLGRYGEFPVDNYTGQVNINLPIYKIISGELVIPITISYRPTGIKVDEAATWVGLGWTLNVGGVITRSIRGLGDEEQNGFLNSPEIPNRSLDSNDLLSSNTYKDYVFQVGNNYIDAEPDVFFFNFNGYSGKFVFDKNSNVHILPYQDIKIKSNDPGFRSWTIITPDGTNYLFGNIDGKQAIEEINAYTRSYNNDGTLIPKPILEPGNQNLSAWYLVKIVTPEGRVVDFNYERVNYIDRTQNEENVVIGWGNNILARTKGYTEKRINGLQLKSIESATSIVKFHLGEKRQDVEQSKVNYPDFPRSLDCISIEDQEHKEIKRFKFHTSYFMNDNSSKYSSKRLKLDKIVEYDENAIKSIVLYDFVYDRTCLPDRFSNSVDHWGYFNNCPNSTLIPDFQDIITNSIGISEANSGGAEWNYSLATAFKFEGANRNPCFPAMQASSLKEIHYSTGGYTKLNYSPHTFCEYDINKGVKPLKHIKSQLEFKLEPDTSVLPSDIDKIPDSFERIFKFKADSSVIFNVVGFYPSPKTTGCPCYNHEIVIENVDTGLRLFKFDYSDYRLAASNEAYGVSFASMNRLIILEPNSNYRLRIKRYCGNNDIWIGIKGDCYNSILGRNESGVFQNIAGGLKIDSIENYVDDNNHTVQKYSYLKSDSIGLYSSGIMLNLPRYHQYGRLSTSIPIFVKVGLLKGINEGNISSTCLTINSGCVYELGAVQGGQIGYQFVEIENKKHENGRWSSCGRELFEYTSLLDYQDYTIPELGSYIHSETFGTLFYEEFDSEYNRSGLFYPYAPQVNLDWKRGLIKKISTFDNRGTLLKDQFFYYNPVEEKMRKVVIPALKVKKHYPKDLQNNSSPISGIFYYDFAKYEILSGWNYKVSEQEIFYHDHKVSRISEFFYNSLEHAFLTSKRTIGSDGKQILLNYYYPNDFTKNNEVLTEMVSRYNIASVVKEEIKMDGDLEEGNMTIFRFGTVNSNLLTPNKRVIVKDKVCLWDSSKNSFIEDFVFDDYDNHGNLLQYRTANNYPISLYWGYNGTKTTAKIDNMVYSSITSALKAELDKLSNFTTMDTPLKRANLKVVNDLIRVKLPPGALATTYTFDPLIGMTSQTDPNGVTTYYEYDSFGRLQYVKDDQGNILKKYDYHYRTGNQ